MTAPLPSRLGNAGGTAPRPLTVIGWAASVPSRDGNGAVIFDRQRNAKRLLNFVVGVIQLASGGLACDRIGCRFEAPRLLPAYWGASLRDDSDGSHLADGWLPFLSRCQGRSSSSNRNFAWDFADTLCRTCRPSSFPLTNRSALPNLLQQGRSKARTPAPSHQLPI